MKRRRFIKRTTIAGLSLGGFPFVNSCETEIKKNSQTYMGGFKANPIREIKAAFVVLEIEVESMQEILKASREPKLLEFVTYMKLALRKP